MTTKMKRKRKHEDDFEDNIAPKRRKIDTEETINRLTELVKKYEILDPKMGISWFLGLEKEFLKPYFESLNIFLKKERIDYTVYPDKEDIWAWTKYCKVNDVNVVILGQNPYHFGQANGLAFSIKNGFKIPRSLLNIFKVLEDDIEGFKRPENGDLTKWAQQGVLLLNSSLTVRKGESKLQIHAKEGWKQFTDAVIQLISDKNNNVVFLLWGKKAEEKETIIDKNKHKVLKTSHPSGLSCRRGFLTCKHFSKCNKLLSDCGKTPIDWTLNSA